MPRFSVVAVVAALLVMMLVAGREALAQVPVRVDGPALRAVYDGVLRPDAVAAAFSRMDRLVPSAVVPRGTGPMTALPLSQKRIGGLKIRWNRRSYDLVDYLSLNRVAGTIILKDGRVVYEDYELGTKPETGWASFSMAKSITSTLMGVALRDGFIKSLDDPVVRYLPALKGSAYDGVNLRQLLQMSSGVAWNEDYDNPLSERRRLLDAHISGVVGAEQRFMGTLARAAPPGTRWNYNTGETFLVGDVLRAATGMPLSRYLSERIWAPLGMERDAGWWLQSDGVETGGSGFSATLRDYARFGLFVLDGGRVNGAQIVPGSWFAEATMPGSASGQRGDLGYGYQWWTFPPTADPIHAGAFMASGIFGQTMYLNPRERLVIVVLSARSKPVTTTVIPDTAFFAAAASMLR